ncbi:MAG: hypothetical protein ACR2NY_04325 [Alphaproteobacteria bacterium]
MVAKKISIPKPIGVIMARLNQLAEVRVVGGAVRDQLIDLQHHSANHYDLAIKTTPNKLKNHAMQFTDWRLVLDGFEHGIIRIISDNMMVEVACLRHDVTTDGRHAIVKFGNDWHADAQRRDFTINAIYADKDGKLFDPLGAMIDFSPLTLRFIGIADNRIKEDYLRILRYYRFLSTLPIKKHYHTDRQTIVKHKAGLKKISHERIGIELLKILSSSQSLFTIRIMAIDGIWQTIGFMPAMSKIKKISPAMVNIINHWSSHRRMVFYYFLLRDKIADKNLPHHKKNFAWSKTINKLISVYQTTNKTLPLFEFHYRTSDDAYHILLMQNWLNGKITKFKWQTLSIATQPKFPLADAGNELKALGFTTNDFIKHLPRLEKKWLASRGKLQKNDLFNQAIKLLKKST